MEGGGTPLATLAAEGGVGGGEGSAAAGGAGASEGGGLSAAVLEAGSEIPAANEGDTGGMAPMPKTEGGGAGTESDAEDDGWGQEAGAGPGMGRQQGRRAVTCRGASDADSQMAPIPHNGSSAAEVNAGTGAVHSSAIGAEALRTPQPASDMEVGRTRGRGGNSQMAQKPEAGGGPQMVPIPHHGSSGGMGEGSGGAVLEVRFADGVWYRGRLVHPKP